MSARQHRDLADRVEDAVRAYLLRQVPADPSGELGAKPFRELLHIYGNWRGRHPFPRPRTVHRSREMVASAEAQAFSAEVAALVGKMEAGVDLKPHLSRAVDSAFLSSQERAALPPHQRERDRDRMIADWGHSPSSSFGRRGSRWLRPAREPSPLRHLHSRRRLPPGHLHPPRLGAGRHAAHRHPQQPGVGPFHKLRYATGATYQPTEQEGRRNRRLGVSSGFIEVDGEWYGVLGQSAAGMPSGIAHPVMALGEELRLLREDPAGRLAQLAADLDNRAGHHVVGDWTPLVGDDIVGLQRGEDAVVQLGVLPGES